MARNDIRSIKHSILNNLSKFCGKWYALQEITALSIFKKLGAALAPFSWPTFCFKAYVWKKILKLEI